MLDSFELNKILGAILGTCLGVVALNIAAGAVFAPVKPVKPGFEIEVPTTPPPGGGTTTPTQPEVPLEELLVKADATRGAESAKKCMTCHTFDKGGRPLIGPNLYGIVGRPKASEQGFNYSPALKQVGGNWTIPDLFKFIANPKTMVPGTAMTFPGISRPSERADLLAYLNSLSDNPQPLKAEAPAKTRAAQAPHGTLAQ